MAIACLNRLVKTQVLFASGDDDFSVAIREVLDELTNPLTPAEARLSAALQDPDNSPNPPPSAVRSVPSVSSVYLPIRSIRFSAFFAGIIRCQLPSHV